MGDCRNISSQVCGEGSFSNLETPQKGLPQDANQWEHKSTKEQALNRENQHELTPEGLEEKEAKDQTVFRLNTL